MPSYTYKSHSIFSPGNPLRAVPRGFISHGMITVYRGICRPNLLKIYLGAAETLECEAYFSSGIHSTSLVAMTMDDAQQILDGGKHSFRK